MSSPWAFGPSISKDNTLFHSPLQKRVRKLGLVNFRKDFWDLGKGVKNWPIGSLSNDDGDGNENGKKAVGLDWKNNNFARHDYVVKVPNFTVCRGRERKTTAFFFFSWTLIESFRIQLQKKLSTFDELNEVEQVR